MAAASFPRSPRPTRAARFCNDYLDSYQYFQGLDLLTHLLSLAYLWCLRGVGYVQDERYIAIEHMDVRRDCFSYLVRMLGNFFGG